jgi:hypothetical protein
LQIDISNQLKGTGSYSVTFQFTGGACRLGIESVELLAAGTVTAADRHCGVTGNTSEANSYSLEIKDLRPGVKYELRASIRAEGGNHPEKSEPHLLSNLR